MKNKEAENFLSNVKEIELMTGRIFKDMTGPEQITAIMNWAMYKNESRKQKRAFLNNIFTCSIYVLFTLGILYLVFIILKAMLHLAGVV